MYEQLPLFQPECDWHPIKICDLPLWANAQRVAVDVETKDSQLRELGPGVRRGGYIVGISFAIEDGPAHYVPLRHLGGDNVEDPESALQYFRDQADNFTGIVCGANLSYDLDYLAEVGIVFRKCKWFRDVQVAEPLLDELQDSYSLDNIAQRRGLPGKDERLLAEAADDWKIDVKKGLWQLPARYVATYGIQDVRLPLQLLRRQEREIDEQDLWRVYDLESQVLPVLVKMRRRGMRIDLERLAAVERWSAEQETQNLQLVYEQTGVRIAVGDVWRPEPIAGALQKIGVVVPRTAKTGQPSIDKNLLDQLDHPVATALSRARRVNKLRTTFAASVRKHLIGDRIHCTFNQLRKTDDGTGTDSGARYGRISCTDPNLQQQPSRDDFATMWRSIYVPDEGGLWAACDFSQQEPRMLMHFAHLAKCEGAWAAVEKYRSDPSADNHTLMARLIYGYADNEQPSKTHRTNAKIIFLGLCYGMGGAKLATSLGLPTKWIMRKDGRKVEVAGDEAQAILDKFNKQVPFVARLAKMCSSKAARAGFIKTLSGRRCRFPRDPQTGEFDWTHKALNRLIQGSSADQTKMVMVALDAAGFKMQLQVHDEIGQTVSSKSQAEEIAKIMQECVALEVPSKVDVEVGPSWGEAK